MFKSKLVLAFAALLLLSDISLSQEFKYETKQSTFLEAESAKIYQSSNGVLLSVVGLNPESKVGTELTFEGLTEPEIEVTRLIDFQGITVGVYPPLHLMPTDGVYLVLGNPGDKFGVRARTSTGVRQLIITLEGTANPPPVEPPPVPGNLTQADLDAITTLVSTSIRPLQDPVTARYLKTELDKLSLSEVLREAASSLKEAIGKALVDSMKEVRPPYKDWEGAFRKPLDKRIQELVATNKVVTGKDLQRVVVAISKGLEPSTARTASTSKATIKMYTRSNCLVCKKWKNEIYPQLKAVGWKLEEINDPIDGYFDFIPRFIICDNGKCSEVIVGYMSIEKFKLFVDQMNGTTN